MNYSLAQTIIAFLALLVAAFGIWYNTHHPKPPPKVTWRDTIRNFIHNLKCPSQDKKAGHRNRKR